MDTSVNIGTKIKMARLSKGLTQKQLGSRVGVNDSAIAKYENGKVQNIKKNILQKLADELGLSPYELIVDTPPTDFYINGTLFETIPKAKKDDILERIIRYYETLNDRGRDKLLSYVVDLSENEKYTINEERKESNQ